MSPVVPPLLPGKGKRQKDGRRVLNLSLPQKMEEEAGSEESTVLAIVCEEEHTGRF